MTEREQAHSKNIVTHQELLKESRRKHSAGEVMTDVEIAAYSGWRLHKDKEIDERERLNLVRTEVMGLTSVLIHPDNIINQVDDLFRMDGGIEMYPDKSIYHLAIESRDIGIYGCKSICGPDYEPFCWLVKSTEDRLPAVFTKIDGSKFTIDELVNDLGFRVQLVYSSRLCINARRFETATHMVLDHLPLGHRGHRKVGMGANHEQQELNDSYVADIFLTYLETNFDSYICLIYDIYNKIL